MEIIKLKLNELKPYEKNAKIHTPEQIEQIKKSIEEFGMNDPIAVWGKDNLIVEGHGRLEALKELGYEEVECIRLDHLTDEERKAYTLAHNKLTMNTDFDFDILNEELLDIDTIDMSDFGFDIDLDIETEQQIEEENPYTMKVDIPQYQITGDDPSYEDMVNNDKVKQLIDEINNSNIDDKEKQFLIMAAQRHLVFNYRNIAEHYAHANKEVQNLMEKSALVIIDYNDAIKNGYANLKQEVEELYNEDD